ncbi:hypothetical protein FHG87_005619 [Trinorchestia longiramus]|nr:hypothetical protein FHG87_005619 [Trinorchestia longiramus]
MHVLESADEGIALEQHRLEQQLEQQKREWELDRQRALQSTDPLMRTGVKRPLQDDDDEEDDDPLTVPADQVNERSGSDDSDDDEGSDSSSSSSSNEGASDSEGEGGRDDSDSDKISNNKKNYSRNCRRSKTPDEEKEEREEKEEEKEEKEEKEEEKEKEGEGMHESTPRTRSRVQVDIDLWTLDERDKSCGRDSASGNRNSVLAGDAFGDSPNAGVNDDDESIDQSSSPTPADANCAEVDINIDDQMVYNNDVALPSRSNGDVESAAVVSHDYQLNNGDEASLMPVDQAVGDGTVLADVTDDGTPTVTKLKLDLVNTNDTVSADLSVPNGGDGVG